MRSLPHRREPGFRWRRTRPGDTAVAGAHLWSNRFAGKGVIVTGASSGIGRAMAIAFARCGAGVLGADVAEPQEEWGDVGEAGGEVVYQRVEVTNTDDLRAAVDTCIEKFGAADVMV